MEYDGIMAARLSVLESRIAAVEQQVFVLAQGTAIQKRHKRDLTPEERVAIRARLVAGQEKKRQEREALVASETAPKTGDGKKAAKNGKKEATHGASEAAN